MKETAAQPFLTKYQNYLFKLGKYQRPLNMKILHLLGIKNYFEIMERLVYINKNNIYISVYIYIFFFSIQLLTILK